MPAKLYPHQQDALDRMFNGCILYGGVGSGKTKTAIEYYMKVEADADVYVITTARKRDSLDWEGEFAQYGIGPRIQDSVGGTLVVDSWNNISKYTDTRGAFFIFDEQRLVGSGEWTKAFIDIAKANRWILLSATPGDTWLDYIPVFLAHGFYKNRTEFKREHVVYNHYSKFPKVERYTNVGKLVRLRNKLLVHMPYQKHTTRHLQIVETEYDKELFARVLEKRWHVYEDRPLRDVGEMFSVMRKVVNSDSSRIQTIKTLMEEHPKLIVFYNFDYELEMLRTLTTSHAEKTWPTEETRQSEEIGSSTKTESDGTPESITKPETLDGFQLAEWNGHKHQEVPKTDRWVYLVQYVAGAEAWNCIETDVVVFYTLTYSYKNFEQAMGRIDRLNTPFAKLFYKILKSPSVIDDGIWSSLSRKQDFNVKGMLRDLTFSLGDI